MPDRRRAPRRTGRGRAPELPCARPFRGGRGPSADRRLPWSAARPTWPAWRWCA